MYISTKTTHIKKCDHVSQHSHTTNKFYMKNKIEKRYKTHYTSNNF